LKAGNAANLGKKEYHLLYTSKLKIMKPKPSNYKMRLSLMVFAGIVISVVVIISCQKSIKTSNTDTISNTEFNVVAPIQLNLSDGKQKSDFQNYLKKNRGFFT